MPHKPGTTVDQGRGSRTEYLPTKQERPAPASKEPRKVPNPTTHGPRAVKDRNGS